jgi:AbrB family looped-hinge helix DNA binding protein
MNKIVTITNRGMITIPASMRKKYDLQDGQPLVCIDQEDKMILIPIFDFEKERKNFVTKDEMKKILQGQADLELKLEEIEH